MKIDTPDLATHLLKNPEDFLYPFGRFLRSLSLDELPNLINIIKGEMNFIGPRPALHNQDDLMNLRRKYGIDRIKPGLSGWAQVNGRDSISNKEKVKLEKFYLENASIYMNYLILFRSFFSFISPKNQVKH
tara:strand:- start:118 stop:510 length:393 start_codon:yes stop_codon:yes gene_type:complete